MHIYRNPDWTAPNGGSSLIWVHVVCNIGFQSVQAFRFMVGPGQCPMISKYGP